MAMGVVIMLMLLAGGARITHLGLVSLAAAFLAFLAIAQKAYRLRRITSFLNPWDDPLGAGHQIIQSYLAFGSGGVFGRGLGEGRQKLLFCRAAFGLHLCRDRRGAGADRRGRGAAAVLRYPVARASHRPHAEGFSRMLALGITSLICVQALINMAVVTGIMPTKGIALPLISYGGSALVVTLAAVGVLLNISKETG